MKLLTIITWATEKGSKYYFFLLEKACWPSISEKVLSAQVCLLACVSNMVLWLKTGIKLVLQREGKLKKPGHVKKVILTTNNRIQAGFNSPRQKANWEALDTKSTHNSNVQLSEKILASLKMFKTFYFTSDWRNDPFFL